MRYPDFLIIGAMKAGTTTLYEDLRLNEHIFMPDEKEPGVLRYDRVLSPEGRKAYADLFRPAHAHQRCGEASTGYSKRPDFEGVPQRALELCGPDLKIIYIIREPIERIRSHYKHSVARGNAREPIDSVVARDPRYINWSRYAYQITPWINTFGATHVCVIDFEHYVNHRHDTIARVSRFIEVPTVIEAINTCSVYNATDGKPVARGALMSLRLNRFYRTAVRPLIGPDTRRWFRNKMLPTAKAPHAEIDTALDAQLRDELRGDSLALEQIKSTGSLLWISSPSAGMNASDHKAYERHTHTS